MFMLGNTNKITFNNERLTFDQVYWSDTDDLKHAQIGFVTKD